MSRQDVNDRRREEAKKQTARRRKQKRRRRAAKVWVGVLLVLLITAVILCLTVFFPIEEIRITGQSQYSQEQILSASGLEVSQNLFVFLPGNVTKQIEKELPYIEKAKIKRVLPGTVHIEVSPAAETFSYSNDGTEYYITCANGKVLRQSNQPAENTAIIKGVAVGGALPGDALTFTDASTKTLMQDLAKWIGNHDLSVTEIDLSSIVNITVVVEGRIRVNLGTQTDLIYKIAHMVESIKNVKPNAHGTLDLSSWSREKPQGFFRESQDSGNTGE